MCPASEIPITQRITEIRQQLPEKYPERDTREHRKRKDEDGDEHHNNPSEKSDKQHEPPKKAMDPNKGDQLDVMG